jgi:replication factor A1
MGDEKIDILTERVLSRFKGKKIDPKEVSKRLKLLICEFKVPEEEAVRTVTNYLLKEFDLALEEVTESPIRKISEITRAGEWVSVKAKVMQLWDTESPNLSQVGLAGDPTGIIKFVVWAKSRKPEVIEGRSYLFKNVVTDSFRGRMQINVNRNSDIIELDEDIELPPREIELIGALVAIQQNSGFIQRCKICNRVLKKDVCSVHGKVEGYDDLRIKGVIDDGISYYEVILNQENIKSLTGMGIEEARKIASERLDREYVLEELKKKLLGQYFRINGSKGSRYFLVRDIQFLTAPVVEEAEKILAELDELEGLEEI